MLKVAEKQSSGELVSQVQRLILDRIGSLGFPAGTAEDQRPAMPVTMLRTRLAVRLAGCGPATIDRADLKRICAATEMAHAAIHCHSDAIDGGFVHAGRPAVSPVTSPSNAVLMGDVLLCEALDFVLDVEAGRYLRLFVSKVREVCAADAGRERSLRGEARDEPTCSRPTLSRTGPLFALVGYVCGGEDAALASALEEAGYGIGAAYQIADEQTSDLCRSALDGLKAWPCARAAVSDFLLRDLRPALEQCPHG